MHSIYRSEESFTWQTMTAVKSDILKRMDTAPIGVRVCCIKFVQKVVQVQTPGVISDPRVRSQHKKHATGGRAEVYTAS